MKKFDIKKIIKSFLYSNLILIVIFVINSFNYIKYGEINLFEFFIQIVICEFAFAVIALFYSRNK